MYFYSFFWMFISQSLILKQMFAIRTVVVNHGAGGMLLSLLTQMGAILFHKLMPPNKVMMVMHAWRPDTSWNVLLVRMLQDIMEIWSTHFVKGIKAID